MELFTAQLIGAVVCLIFSAFFSAAETAYTSFNKTRMKTLATEGNRRAAKVLKLADAYDKLLSTILVGNNIVNITLSTIATLLFVQLCTGTTLESSAAVLSTVVITVAVLIFGEISPKSIAKEHAEGFALAIAPFLQVLIFLLTPVNAFFMLWKKLLTAIFKNKAEDTLTESEFLTLLDEAHEDGEIDEYNKELIENIFDFDDTIAATATTHRTDVVMLSLEESDTWEDIVMTHRFDRFPIIGEDADDIVGILEADIFLRMKDRTHEKVMQEAVRPPYFVPESVKMDVLLRNMKKAKEQMAVVLDEHGGTVGIVTANALVEYLIGDFSGEEEPEDGVPDITPTGENLWQIRGSVPVTLVNEETGAALDEDTATTLSGLMLSLIGIIPEEGATFTVETESATLKALSVGGRTVELAEVFVKPKPEDAEEKAE